MDKIFIAVIGLITALVYLFIHKTPHTTPPKSDPPIEQVPIPQPSPLPQLPHQDSQENKVVKLPPSCALAERIPAPSQFPGSDGMRCAPNQPNEKLQSGPDYVTEIPISEFIIQVNRNVALIESYERLVLGTTEGDASAANSFNAKSVVEFAEFLNSNLNTLNSLVGSTPSMQRAIYHAERLDDYRKIYDYR